MTKIRKLTSSEKLKTSIALLEQKRIEDKTVLKEQFSLVAENFQPVNILKRAIHEIAGTFDLKNQLVHSGVGLLAGYFTRKIGVKSSPNPFLRLAGVAFQYGVTNYISKNSDVIGNKIVSFFRNLTGSRSAPSN